MVTRATVIVAAALVGGVGLMAQGKEGKASAKAAVRVASEAEKAEEKAVKAGDKAVKAGEKGENAGDSERKIQKNELPGAVQKAMEREIQGATVKGYAKEVDEGKTFYEVETTKNGRARDLLYTPDGTLAEVEEAVPMDSVPAAAKTALEAQGKLKSVEKVTEGSNTFYEGHYAKGSKKSEMKVTADGKPVTK